MRVPVVTLTAVGLAVGCFICFNSIEDKKTTETEKFVTVAEIAAVEEKAEVKEAESMIETESKAEIEEDTEMAYVSPYDFAELHAINDDIVAWVTIPETSVDYPIVFNGDEDYLEKGLDGQYSYSGTPFVDKEASEPMKDNVNIVYGHHMKDGSMFAAIDEYNDPDFFKAHNNIIVFLEEEELSLTPIVTITGKADASVRTIDSVDSLNEFAEGKTISAGELPENVDDLYVFVTCNYTGNDYRTYLICSND